MYFKCIFFSSHTSSWARWRRLPFIIIPFILSVFIKVFFFLLVSKCRKVALNIYADATLHTIIRTAPTTWPRFYWLYLYDIKLIARPRASRQSNLWPWCATVKMHYYYGCTSTTKLAGADRGESDNLILYSFTDIWNACALRNVYNFRFISDGVRERKEIIYRNGRCLFLYWTL